MRIAVVGATGVLGRDLVPLLLNHGHRVRALVRSPENAQKLAAWGADLVECDLIAADAATRLPDLLQACQAVIHIATAIPHDRVAPGAWDRNTRLRTEGTQALLDAALIAGVNRYIQQSITMAYPDGGDNWLDESTLLDTLPDRANVTAPVIQMEAMVRSIPPDRLKWCILRGGAFVGPGTAQDDMVAQLHAGTARVPCDGRNFISPVHVADMATAISAACDAPAGSIFNIVDEPIRNAEYMDRLAARVGVAPPPRDPAQPCPPSWRCSNRTARMVLGWTPTHGIGI